MKITRITYCFFLVLVVIGCLGSRLNAQDFSVRVGVTIVTPSPYLEEYAEGNNLLVTVTLVADRPTRDGILKLSLTNGDFTATTRNGIPLTLTRGVPLILRGPQLRDLLDLNNLDISGFGIENTVENGGRLPEGLINICGEFFAINFPDQPISNTGCGSRFVLPNDPPQLNLPFEDAAVAAPQEITPFNFNWSPRHYQQPTDRYVLELFELVPGLSWDQVISSSLLYRSAPERRFLLAYNPLLVSSQPQLEIGKRYLWRVRIQDVNPASDRTFVNFGYSQPQAFTYGTEADITAACPQVARFFAQGLGAHTGELGWEMANTERLARAELRYRVIDGTWSNPEEVSATGSPYPLNDLMPATAYEAELCLNCTAGNKSCETVSFTTLTEEEDCGPLVAPVAVPLSETSLALRWPVVTQATGFTLSWGPTTVSPTDTRPSTPTRQQQRLGGIPRQELPSPGTRDRADENTSSNNRGGPDSLQLAAGSTEAIIDGLAIGTSYDFRFCKQCPDGSRECYEWTENFVGIDDACLTNLDVSRTDSSDTTLELAWTYTGTVPDSFQFIWQVSDGSYPADTATVAFADSSYTITERIPGLVYTLKVCAECTSGQPVCRDLPPFGGCVAEYTPELVDATLREALLGWPVEGETVTTQLRYRMRAFGGWNDAPVGELRDFSGGDYLYSDEQLAQTQLLRPQLIYLAQVRTQCFDTLWSAWSEPVRFSLACTLDEVDTLTVLEVTDSSAYISAFSIANAVHYSFEYRLAGTETWTVSEELEESNLALAGLSADTEYEVRMRYFCSRNAWSNYSQIQTFRTLPPCGMPMDIAYTDITFNSAQINWTPGENALETKFVYRLLPINRGYYLTAPGAWEEAVFSGNNESLTQLEDGLAYEIKALTNCGVNESPATPFDTLRLACAPPEVLVSDVSVDAATVALTGPTGYTPGVRFSYRKLGEEEWVERNGYSGFAFGYLTELDDYSTYELRGRYDCPSGETAPWSDTLQFTTPVDCRVPENLGVVDLMTDGADLRWDVTGTVTEWEVCLLEQDPQAQQQVTMEGVQRQQMSTDGEEEAGGGGSLNEDQNVGGGGDRGPGNTGPSTPPDPYANWQRFTVTDPGKLFAGLRANMNYKVVVRASCPVEGWTDYSEELAFRTLCPSQAPDTAYADQMLASSAVLNWSRVYLCAETYSVVLESLEPLPVTNTTAVSDPFGRVGNASADGETAIYRDSTITDNTSATFGNLLANKEYRFRVRTRTTYNNFVPAAAGYTTMADVGADAGARIVGASGYSEYTDWYTFRTDHCAQPYDIIENPVDRTTMEISWTPSNGVNNYRVDYRLLQDGAQPAYELTSEAFVRLTPLISNGVYEYSVTELCQNGEDERGSPQDTFRLKRPSIQNGFYVCGVQTEVNTDNMTPLQVLAVGDTIRAYDFPVVITEVSGSGGNFSGLGEIRMPYFNKAKFAFAFEGIFVNDDYQMADGYLEATGFGVEVLPPWADELLGEIMGALQMLDAYTQDQQLELLDSLMACCPGSVPPALQQRIFNIQNCYAQQDESNNPNYSLCEDMLDDLMASIDSLLNSIYGGTFQVQFAPDPEQSFGFDGWQSNYPEEWYEVEGLAGEDYIVAYKSTKLGATDKVRAVLPTPAHTDSVGFELPDGSPPAYTFDGNQALIQFANTHPAGDDYFIAASQLPVAGDTTPPYVAGLLNVIPYPELPLNVTLVPLSSAAATGLNAASIRQGLAGILGQALVEPSVFVDDVFTTNYGAPLDAVESGLLTNYNGEMRDIIAAYSEQEAITNDRYYLFVLAEADYEDIARSGFMPRGRQFGFLYRGNIDGDAAFTRTLAHELAHGAYVLKHTWDEYPDAMPEGATQNLMDKQGGTELLKWQWDLVHDPVGAPLLPGDESGESHTLTNMTVFNPFRHESEGAENTLSFETPAGQIITLPSTVKSVTFNTGDEIGVRESCFSGFDVYPFGSLRSFVLQDDRSFHTAIVCGDQGKFYGYRHTKEDGSKVTYIDTLSKKLLLNDRDAVIVGVRPKQGLIEWFARDRMAGYSHINEPNYRGSGARKAYNFLMGGDADEIVVLNDFKNNDPLSENAILFLQTVLVYPLTSAQTLTYAYAHAHQISKYPELSETCDFASMVGIDYPEYQKRLKKMYEKSYPDGYDGSGFSPEDIFSMQEFRQWKFGTSVTIYKKYQDYHKEIIENDQWIHDLPESNAGAITLFKRLADIYDLESCMFSDLSNRTRIKILKVLSHKTEITEDLLANMFIEGHDSQEHIYNFILRSTPADSAYVIVDAYEDDQDFLWRSYQKMNDPLWFLWMNGGIDGTGTEDFIGNLYTLFSKDTRRSQFKVVPASFQAIRVEDPPSDPTYPSSYFDDYVSHYYLTEINSGSVLRDVKYYAHHFSNSPDNCFEDYSTSITPSDVINTTRNGLVLSISGRHCQGVYPDLSKVTTTGDAFDLALIQFAQPINFPYLNSGDPEDLFVPENTIIVVPLFFAKFLLDKLVDAEYDRNTRIFVDAIGIAVGIATFPASGMMMVIAAADIIYNVVDIVYLANDDYTYATTGAHSIDQELKDIWGYFGYLSMGGTGFTILETIGSKTIIYANRIGAAYKLLKETNPAEVLQLRTRLRSTITALERRLSSVDVWDQAMIRGVVKRLRAQIFAIETTEAAGNSIVANAYRFSSSPLDLGLYLSKEGRIPVKIAGSQIENGIYSVKPDAAKFVDDIPAQATEVATLNNVSVVDGSNTKVFCSLKIVEALVDGEVKYLFKILNPIDAGVAYQFPNYFRLCVAKGWNYNELLTPAMVDFLTQLPSSTHVRWVETFQEVFSSGQFSRLTSVLNEFSANANRISALGRINDISPLVKIVDGIEDGAKRAAIYAKLEALRESSGGLNNLMQSIGFSTRTEAGLSRLLTKINSSDILTPLLSRTDRFRSFAILRDAPSFAVQIDKLDQLIDLAPVFKYQGLEGFEALGKLFENHQSVGRAFSNMTEILAKVEISPVGNAYVTGIKTGRMDIYAETSVRIASCYSDGVRSVVMPDNFLGSGTLIPGITINGFKLVQRGGSIGFRATPSLTKLGAPFRKFAESIGNAPMGKASSHKSFYMYGEKMWVSLEEYMKASGINKVFDRNPVTGRYDIPVYGPDGRQLVWPPMDGGYNIQANRPVPANTVIDRYAESWAGLDIDGDPNLYGRFFSPLNNGSPYPYLARALKVTESENALFFRVTVKESTIGDFGDVIPWFGKPGNAKQVMVRFGGSLTEAAKSGKISIEIVSAPSAHPEAVNFIGHIIE